LGPARGKAEELLVVLINEGGCLCSATRACCQTRDSLVLSVGRKNSRYVPPHVVIPGTTGYTHVRSYGPYLLSL